MSTPPYYPSPAELVDLWHEEWRHDARVNSELGDQMAAAHGKDWIDNDFGLSIDLVWCNGHQNPSYIWFPRGESFRHFSWAHLQKRIINGRHLRNDLQAFLDAHRHGLKVEVEVKFVGPISDQQLADAMTNLRTHAQLVWGDEWQAHVRVKVLTCLKGGTKYALRILRAAHAAGFHTILLARGAATLRRFRNHTEITWVRGSRVIRHKKAKK